MKLYKYAALACMGLTLATTACVDDLDVKPDDPQTKLELNTTDEWYGYLGSLYGSLLYEGNISWPGYNDGDGVFMRCHWNAQELTADDAVIMNKWSDPGYNALFEQTWLDNNGWLYLCYAREADLARKATTFIDILATAGDLLTDAEKTAFAAEARVLRAFAYYNMIDMFGRGPWVVGATTGAIPPTYSREELFDATVADLAEAIPSVPAAAQQTYGRVSREAAYMLLAKLYLNAEVYTGKAMWQECADLCLDIKKAIPWNPSIEYKYLFCATNDKYVGNSEIIWAVPQDANTIQTYGGTTYLSVGAYNSKVDCLPYGCAGDQWAGPRVHPQLSKNLLSTDKRRLIFEGKLHEDVTPEDMSDWTEDGGGYMCVKYVYTPETNYNNAGGTATAVNAYNNTDYPLFRLADVYLMLAECEKHGASGCEGVDRFNDVRLRAGVAPVGSYSLDDLLKERQCELYWEGHRRSDLIRFGKYTGNSYNWEWKSGSYNGAAIADHRNLYAIPVQFEATLGQNPGYPTGGAIPAPEE